MPNTTLSVEATRATSGARLFVSYSRKDRDFAERLSAALGATGHEVWVDLKDIRPSEEWLEAIHAAIEGADAVVFVVSPDSVDPASVCLVEVAHAAQHHKRFVPVLYRNVDTRVLLVPDVVARLNWVSFVEPVSFDVALVQLVFAVETDLDWVRQHTRLLERAVEWQRAQRDDSFALQKNDLSAAERWLAQGPIKEPAPTALQTEYVLDSRAAATRRQRRLLLFGVAAAALIAIGVTVAAYQYSEAQDRRKEAQARALAAEAHFERGRRLDRAVPLALRALSMRETHETVDAAIAVGQATFDVVRVLIGHSASIEAICFPQGGRHLVSAARDGRVIVWDIVAGSPLQLLASAPADEKLAIACSPSTPFVAIATGGGNLVLWRLDAGGVHRVAEINEADAFGLLSFSGDGAWLATSDYGSVTLRSAANGVPVISGFRMEDGISSLALSHNATWIAIGTPGGREIAGKVALWRHGASAPAFVDGPYPLGVRSVGVDADGGRVLAIDVEGDIRAWKTDGTQAKLSLPEKLGLTETRAAAFDRSGRHIVSADGRAAVVMTAGRPNEFDRVQRLVGHARPVTAVAVDGGHRRAATGSEDGTLIVHSLRGDDDLEGGQQLAVDGAIVEDATFSTDGRAVIVAYSDGGKPFRKTYVLPFMRAASFAGAAASAAPVRFSVALDGLRALLKDMMQPAVLAQIEPEPGQNVMAGAVTPDGRRWAAASENVLRIIATGDGQPLVAALPAGFGIITALAITPDGRLVAVAGGDVTTQLGVQFGMSDRSIWLVDTATGRPVGLPLRGMRPSDISRLEFSPDGQYLISVGVEAIVWFVGPRLAWISTHRNLHKHGRLWSRSFAAANDQDALGFARAFAFLAQ